MAYTFDKTDFLKIYPQFATVGVDLFAFNQEFAQKIANSYIPTTEPNNSFKIGTYHVLAYLLSLNTVSGGQGLAGVTSNASEGSVSVGMSIPPLANTWWGRNNLGLTALMFLRSYTCGGAFVSGNLPTDIVDV